MPVACLHQWAGIKDPPNVCFFFFCLSVHRKSQRKKRELVLLLGSYQATFLPLLPSHFELCQGKTLISVRYIHNGELARDALCQRHNLPGRERLCVTAAHNQIAAEPSIHLQDRKEPMKSMVQGQIRAYCKSPGL